MRQHDGWENDLLNAKNEEKINKKNSVGRAMTNSA